MKTIFYLLTFVLGLFGLLALVRSVEVLFSGNGVRPVQVLIAVVALTLAGLCLRKARTK